MVMNNHRKTTPQFIEQAQKVHGDKYDYTEVQYVNTHVPVRIRCRRCGFVFLQEPSSHLAGHGCPKCNKEQTKRKLSQEAFLARAKNVHGGKYDYSKTVYLSMRAMVEITCPVHGPFFQRAQSHLLGHGCPSCKRDAQIERMKSVMGNSPGPSM